MSTGVTWMAVFGIAIIALMLAAVAVTVLLIWHSRRRREVRGFEVLPVSPPAVARRVDEKDL